MDNGLFGAIYNPDVLSCLANLSNDEVFTPPEVVNQKPQSGHPDHHQQIRKGQKGKEGR